MYLQIEIEYFYTFAACYVATYMPIIEMKLVEWMNEIEIVRTSTRRKPVSRLSGISPAPEKNRKGEQQARSKQQDKTHASEWKESFKKKQ